MRGRLLRSLVAVAVVAVLVLGVPLGYLAARVVRDDAGRALDREADAVGFAIDEQLERGNGVDVAAVQRILRPHRRVEITDRAGRRSVAGEAVGDHPIEARITTIRGATIVIQGPGQEVERRARRAWAVVGGLALAAVGAAVALALVETSRLASPLDALAAASARLGAGDFSGRAPRSGLVEVDAVAETLDHSAERIERLVRAEREFSANASHQLRTPLTALRMRLEEIAAAPDAAFARREADAALGDADRLESTIDALLAVARGEASDRVAPIDLCTVVASWAARWMALLGAEGRSLVLDRGEDVQAVAPEAVVNQILDVLADNALRHGGGTVTVDVRHMGRHGAVRLADEGRGVPVGMEHAIFDRHVSGVGGTGVGLALARTLAESCGGKLELVQARPAVFELFLPAWPEDRGGS